MNKILSDRDTQSRLIAAGGDPINEGPQEFAARIKSDIANYAKAAKLAGLKAE
jgi:tripartite-type tricarboxylate transporter receptor subunit TctC